MAKDKMRRWAQKKYETLLHVRERMLEGTTMVLTLLPTTHTLPSTNSLSATLAEP